jgi:hypothetical protein
MLRRLKAAQQAIQHLNEREEAISMSIEHAQMSINAIAIY